MKIAIGSDHGGFELKNQVIELLASLDLRVKDVGCSSLDSVDYPVFADKVCQLVTSGECDRGILICGTGIGMSIAANKHKGIRAALCHEAYTARMSREHNNANVLCIGARVLGVEVVFDLLKVWLEADFGGGRHQKRLAMFLS